MQTISQTNFSTISMMDDFGRVFFQDGKVYRAIRTDKNEYCTNLLNSKLFQELLEKGYLPKTIISDLSVEHYGIILEHEVLLSTLQHEWTFSMLRDTALVIFNINKICNKHGYELKDSHLFNVLFRGTSPVWIDIGSITPVKVATSKWRAYKEYLSVAVIPLSFLSCGKIFIGRKLMESIHYGLTTLPNQNILQSGLLNLLPLKMVKTSYRLSFREWKLFQTNTRSKFLSFASNLSTKFFRLLTRRNTVLFKYCQDDWSKDLTDFFPQEENELYISSLPKPVSASLWQGYHQNYLKEKDEVFYSDRFKRILEIIKSKKDIETVIDLAGNEGLFSQLLYENISNLKRIITTDYDENAIDFAYNKFKTLSTNKLHTVLLNFMYTPDMEGTQKRLRSDLVLALAVTHHLILTANYSLGAIFEKIRSYSNKYVMIEFMPLGLWSSKEENIPMVPDFYNLEWFRIEFNNYFELILEEKLERNRIIFFGMFKQKEKSEF